MGAAATRSLSSDRETRDLITEAETMGFAAERTSGGHIKFTHPRYPDPIFTSSSPSDHRSVANCRAQLRRAVRLMEQAEAEVDAVVGGPRRAYPCNACAGRGTNKSFMSTAALNAHVAKEHPATPIRTPEPEPEKETPVVAAEIVSHDPEKVSKEELAEYLSQTRAIGDAVTLKGLSEEFEPRDIRSSVEVFRQRGVKNLKDLDRFVPIPGHRGRYWWVPAGASIQTAGGESTAERSDRVIQPVRDHDSERKGRIFEVVNEFVDGQLLIRDEEGNLFTANLRPL